MPISDNRPDIGEAVRNSKKSYCPFYKMIQWLVNLKKKAAKNFLAAFYIVLSVF
jgi:hypothetical protein